MLKKHSLLFMLCSLLLSPSNASSKPNIFTRKDEIALPFTADNRVIIEPFQGSVTLKTHEKNTIELVVFYTTYDEDNFQFMQTVFSKGLIRSKHTTFISANTNDPRISNPTLCSISYMITVPVFIAGSAVVMSSCTEVIIDSDLIHYHANDPWSYFSIKNSDQNKK